jgi:hypothetical protein
MSTLQTTTSTGRPSLGTGDAGESYFETDTKNIIVWDGANWRGYASDLITTGLSQGITLDGDSDYGTVSNDSALAISGDLSIVCWVYLDTAKYTPIVSKRVTGGGTTNYDFAWNGQSTSKLNFYDGSASSTSAGTISTGGWTHVAVVIDSGTSTTFYINGTSSAGSAAMTITSDTNDLNFGYLASTSNYLDGKMDDIAIYNRVLTGSEISSIKDDNSFPTNGLAGLWTFEGDSGSTFTDKSGNGNDGTLAATGSIVSVTSHS